MVEDALAVLQRRVESLFPGRELVRTRYGMGVGMGLETRRSSRDYYWDGRQRGGNPRWPHVILQYTLRGWGIYATGGAQTRIEPGMAFAAVVPGRHVYYLPETSAQQGGWTFFYLQLQHPYVARRMKERQQSAGAVWRIDPESAIIGRWLAVMEGIARDAFRDEFAVEQAIFELLTEYERYGHGMIHPQNARQEVLNRVRAHVERRLANRVEVEELAAHWGMSRSHFTHWFSRLTAKTPGEFVSQVRIEAVQRQLLQTRDNLYAIAKRTGFADANHLCKAFRRLQGTSPGEYRRRLGQAHMVDARMSGKVTVSTSAVR